jgi:CheY-like chemotaxis protein
LAPQRRIATGKFEGPSGVHETIHETPTLTTRRVVAPSVSGEHVRPPLVLVIDDEPSCRAACAEYLALIGCRVLVAAGGEEGLELAFRSRPDLVVTDLFMPGTDGCTVARRLRADGRTKAARILGVSSQLAGWEARLRSSGCDDVCEKAKCLEELERIICEIRGFSGVVVSTVQRAPAPTHEGYVALSALGPISGEDCARTLAGLGFSRAEGGPRGTVRMSRGPAHVDVPLCDDIGADALSGLLRIAGVSARDFAAAYEPSTVHRIIGR